MLEIPSIGDILPGSRKFYRLSVMDNLRNLLIVLLIRIGHSLAKHHAGRNKFMKRTLLALVTGSILVLGTTVFTNYVIQYAAFYATVLAGTQFSVARLCEIQVST